LGECLLQKKDTLEGVRLPMNVALVEIITFIPEVAPFIQELFSRCPRKKSLSFGILIGSTDHIFAHVYLGKAINLPGYCSSMYMYKQISGCVYRRMNISIVADSERKQVVDQ
jgi:hypothetical protein